MKDESCIQYTVPRESQSGGMVVTLAKSMLHPFTW